MIFTIGRKLAQSGAISAVSEIYNLPLLVKVFFYVLGFSFKKSLNQNDSSPGVKLCNSLQAMGTTFIKLGQFLATRPDIIGEKIANDLEKLQDKLPAFNTNEASFILREELGEKNFKKISNFGDPVAAASIAQVHFATIEEKGEKKDVAIKILRPNIENLFNEELDALMLIAFIVENLIKKTKRLKLIEVVHLLREITNIEMDLRFEAAAANELHENTINDAGFSVPKIYWNYTTKKILTLDKITEVSIREVDKLKEMGVDNSKLAKNLIQNFLRQAVRDGFFHADMHQGNLFVNKEGTIISVDFGIMGRLSLNNKRYLAEILYGFIQRDYKKVAEVHFLAGLVSKNVSKDDFAQALRSIGEPIFGQSIKDISGGKLLSQLFEITEKFNMQTQPQLLLLQKTMVVVEGVARKLDPETNIWNVSKPILEEWLGKLKDPLNKINEAISNTSEVLKRFPELPRIMDRANEVITLMSEGKYNPGSSTVRSLKEEELKMQLMRNKILGGVLILVIFVLIVFK